MLRRRGWGPGTGSSPRTWTVNSSGHRQSLPSAPENHNIWELGCQIPGIHLRLKPVCLALLSLPPIIQWFSHLCFNWGSNQRCSKVWLTGRLTRNAPEKAGFLVLTYLSNSELDYGIPNFHRSWVSLSMRHLGELTISDPDLNSSAPWDTLLCYRILEFSGPETKAEIKHDWCTRGMREILNRAQGWGGKTLSLEIRGS